MCWDTLKTHPTLGPILATRQPFLGSHCLPPGYGEGPRKCGLNIARLHLNLAGNRTRRVSHFSGRGNDINNSVRNTNKIKLANWNVRTLLDNDKRPERQTALVAKVLAKYDIDIATLTESRLSGEGSIEEIGQGYTFFWRGVPDGQSRIHGVCIAIKNSIVKSLIELPTSTSERIMSVRVPLEKSNHMTIICAYAPTLVSTDEAKDDFYGALSTILQSVDHRDKLMLMGDFNARVGNDHEIWPEVLGRHGTGKMNSNGLRLLSLCQEFNLKLTNTMFQQADIYKNTWKHPRSGHWHMLDHIAIRGRDSKECSSTRAMRGAECGTDHRMQRTILNLKIRPPVRKQGRSSRKLNTNLLKSDPIVLQLQEAAVTDLAPQLDTPIEDLNREWSATADWLLRTATEVLGYHKKRHRDWFDENDEALTRLVDNKNKAHNKYLAHPTRCNNDDWKRLRAELQRETRRMKDEWWTKQAHEIQSCADEGRIQGFYEAIKRVNGPRTSTTCPLKSSSGALVKDKAAILARWAEYFGALLNNANPTDPSAIAQLPQYPVVLEMDAPITEEEVTKAIKTLKAGKAAGPDSLPPDLFMLGDPTITKLLTKFSRKCWETGTVPNNWLRANIVTIYKKKGEKSDCGNYRGLSMLDVAGKIFAKVLNQRFNSLLAEKILPETQSGFRADRSTTDMIFLCRQILEKGREQQQQISLGFIDLKKAFDTVNREMLFAVLKKFGCPPTFLALVRALHSNNSAAVRIGSETSEPFETSMGVKQGCVLAPLLFNVFLLAVSLLTAGAGAGEPNPGVELRYRLDGGAFNIRRFAARTKVSYLTLRDLQYADDAAIVSNDPVELQDEMTRTNCQMERMGLVMNKTKTEVMHRAGTPSNTQAVSIDGTLLPTTVGFTYLGSIISNNCSIEREINNRISKASAAFGQLKDRVYLNRNLKLKTKIKVYEAIVLSILLYSSETWTPYASQLRTLNKFHLRCLRKMLGLTWRDKVPNNDVLSRCQSRHIHSMIAQKTLRWAGHVERMEPNRLPRMILHSELAQGQRPVGRPKKRYKDHLKSTLQSCNIRPANFEATAVDRTVWRSAVKAGVAHYENSLRTKNDQARAARHRQLDPTTLVNADHTCEECDRSFLSRAGLASHQRAHLRRLRGRPTSSNIDGQP